MKSANGKKQEPEPGKGSEIETLYKTTIKEVGAALVRQLEKRNGRRRLTA